MVRQSSVVIAIVFSLALIGCKPAQQKVEATPAITPVAPPPAEVAAPAPAIPPTPSPPAEDPKLAEFNAGMKDFITEAKSLARSMEILPERVTFEKRAIALEEIYSRIPDAPSNDERFELYRRSARQITVDLKAGGIFLGLIQRALRVGSKETADSSFNAFKGIGTKQKANLVELETAIEEKRVPNIELSDVTKGN